MEHSQLSYLINSWGSYIKERQICYEKMLGSDELKSLFNEHETTISRINTSNSFTVFEVISDLYYRENFHSDLIAFFLDPNENHGMGSLGIELLIDLIVEETGWHINANDYDDSTVVREEGRIDILIRDDYSKHAILVENKMNNAGDMDRQIPRYCDILEEQGYIIDAAVYLPMLKYKTPDKSSWKENDFRWENKIVIIPAVSDVNEYSLTRNWLEPLAAKCNNEDVASILRQYRNLIAKTSNYNMDKISFDKLYDYLMVDDHLEMANSLVSMMNDLPKYLAQRVFDIYSERCFPFTKVGIYRETDAVFEQCMIDGLYCKMDVWCDTRTFKVQFWAPSDRDISMLQNYASLKDYLKEKGVSIFNEYDISDKTTIIAHFPITTPINVIIEPIINQLRSICQ